MLGAGRAASSVWTGQSVLSIPKNNSGININGFPTGNDILVHENVRSILNPLHQLMIFSKLWEYIIFLNYPPHFGCPNVAFGEVSGNNFYLVLESTEEQFWFSGFPEYS